MRELIRIGFGLEVIGRWCLRAPHVSLLVLLLASIAAAFSASQIGFDDNLYEIYRDEGDEFARYTEMARLFPTIQDRVVAVFEGSGVATGAGLELLRDIHLDVAWIDGVLGVTSIFSAREKADAGGSPSLLFPAELPQDDELDTLLRRALEHPLAGRRLLSLDPPATLITISLDPALDPFDVGPEVVDVINQMVQARADDLDIGVRFTGAPLLRLEILDSLLRDQIVLTVAGALVAFFLCLMFLGRWRLVAVAVVPSAVGVLWTIGAFAAIGQTINVMTNVLPTLVTVIVMADALHLTSAVRRGLGDGLSAPDAARRAADEVGPACAMTSLTTALAFLSLTLSGSAAIVEFGYAGASAAIIAFAAVMTIVPSLSAVLLVPYEGKTSTGLRGMLSWITDGLTHASSTIVSSRPRATVLIGAVVLALVTAAYFSVEPSYTYREFLPDRSEANVAIDRIDALFTGADLGHILIVERDDAPATAPRPAAVVRTAHEIAARTEGILHVDSLATVEEWTGRDLTDWAEGGPGRDDIGLSPHLADGFRNADGRAWLITVSLPAIDARESVPMFDRLDTALDSVRAEAPGYDIYLTGVVPMTARSGYALIGSLNWNLVFAIVVTIALVALALRSLTVGLLVALPNLLPLAAVGAALFLTGTGMQITGVVALTIAFGIAVDDTIHLVHRWELDRTHLPPRAAVISALERVGPVMVATTIVLATGMIATETSGLPMVRLFGNLCILTFVVALLADMFLMPALLITFSRSKADR